MAKIKQRTKPSGRASETVPATDWQPFVQAVAILFAGCFVAFPALHGNWLWDDDQQVTANTSLRTLHGLWQIWFAPGESDYFPLKSTVMWIQWHLWGANPAGFRMFSLVCHLFSALILWRLFEKLGLRWGWLGGLIFAVHPLAVESVAWISETKNTLSLPLLLLSIWFFIEYDAGRKRATLVWSALFFLAAMLCKTSGVMLPATLLLFCWWKRGKIQRRDLVAVIPFLAISVILGIVTIWFQESRAIGVDAIHGGSPLSRLAVAGMEVLFYLWKFLVPSGLCPIYPRWDADHPSVLQLLPVPVLVATFWWFWTQRKGWGRHALFGLGFFVLNLLPVLGFLNMSFMKYSQVSDHFVYLPMTGLIGLAVAGLERLYALLSPSLKMVEQGGICFAIIFLMVQGNAHSAVFHDEGAMWRATLARNPSAWVACDSLAAVYISQGRLPEAVALLNRALEIKPDYAMARYNLGCALGKQGHLMDAVAQYRRALVLQPDLPAAHYNLGLIFAHKENPGSAADQFRAALELDPDYVEAHNGLGVAFVRMGQLSGAVDQFQAVLKINPNDHEASCNLAIALAGMGRTSEALAILQDVLKADPGDTGAQQLLKAIQSRPPASK